MTGIGNLARRVVRSIANVQRGDAVRQQLRLIPGMPAAPEPCCLPTTWSPESHPRDAVAQLKVDGIRAIYVDTAIVTRQALPLDCALHCLPALHALEQHYGEPMVFDGEYLEPDGFQATVAAMRRGIGHGAIWLFDAVPYSEWKVNRFTQPLGERVDQLCELASRVESPFLTSLPLMDVPDADVALAVAEAAWGRKQEGLVVKARRSTYVRGKSSTWQKLKQRQTFDGTIVDALVKDGRCTALMVKMPADSPSPGKVVRVGSNIPDELRAAIARGADVAGAVAEIGFSDTTDTGNLRGGYFIALRHDKAGEL